MVNATAVDAMLTPSSDRLKLAVCGPRVVRFRNPPNVPGGPLPEPIEKCPPAGMASEDCQDLSGP